MLLQMLVETLRMAGASKAHHTRQSIWVGAGSRNSSGMCTLVTLRGRILRLARSLGGSGALLRGPDRGAGTMPALFSSASSSSGSWGICMRGKCSDHAVVLSDCQCRMFWPLDVCVL